MLDEAYADWSFLKLRASEIRVMQGVSVVPLILVASGIFFFLLFLFLLFLVSVSVVAVVCEALFFPQRTVTNSGGK